MPETLVEVVGGNFTESGALQGLRSTKVRYRQPIALKVNGKVVYSEIEGMAVT